MQCFNTSFAMSSGIICCAMEIVHIDLDDCKRCMRVHLMLLSQSCYSDCATQTIFVTIYLFYSNELPISMTVKISEEYVSCTSYR